jgi:hypothetical protein
MWAVIESKFRYTTYREILFRGTLEECDKVLEILAIEEPEKIFERIEC